MDWSYTSSGNIVTLTPSGRLPTNRVWTVVVSPGISGIGEGDEPVVLESSYTFWFTSVYCPLFTTVNRIRLQVGPVADNLIDDTIYRMIMKNSMDAVDLVKIVENSAIAYDYWGCTWHNVPSLLRQYVECKTAYDILALIELVSNNGGGAGSQLKTLGDMTISYGGPSSSGGKVDPGKKKQLYDCWMEMLNGIKALAIGQNPAVRGYYDTSKGFPHPVWDTSHNRVIRAVDFRNSQPYGPWESSNYWRGIY